ncbi:MAG: radical SAM protein [Nitrospirae bacterium RBG_13_39_12]|nr:MAG: radical SAM protein [Nitrospirae bacterium RBG_13_39_12]
MHNSFTLIDTHCHIEMDEFNADREAVIQRARDAGIEAIITIGSDLQGNLGGLKFSEKYDFIYSSVGIHPHDAKDFSEEIFEKIKAWATEYKIQESNPPTPPFTKGGRGGITISELRTPDPELKPKVVAIGEIGLDYHYDNSPREIQKEVFIKQLHYAKEINLPVVVHSREAQKDTLEIIRESGVNRGVLHCFSGDMEMAEKAMAIGFYISIAGPVTFKNARHPREIAKAIPDDYLLIETDAPYLTPEPFRGRRNEPSYIVHTAKAIAELRGITLEDLSRITTLNAKRLFRIGHMSEKGKIAYKIRNTLYLNITNRCTNKCSFCIRFHSDYVKGHNLRLSEEPSEEEIKSAIGDPSQYKEIVFCGYGEPLLRLDLVKNVAAWIKKNKGKVRINTNGHGNLIHGRNIVPELKGIVDRISISLDAHDEKTYAKICRPVFKNAFKEILSFIKEAKKFISEVTVTVVTLEGVNIDKSKKIAENLGVNFRLRKLDVVG